MATRPEVGAMVPSLERPPQHAMQGFDPFTTMDRFDEEALALEMQGRVAEALVYVVKDGGQEVTGLSKEGVDECCMALVTQGQVIREEELSYELIKEGEAEEALFKCKAARYGVSPTGAEVRLDQVIGVKRQPLYYDAALALDLDSSVPGKKYKGRTFRSLLESVDGRDYLCWMAENFRDEPTRDFVCRILAGEDAIVQPGRRLNPHWYEHGAMKAARNARFRLIPGKVRAMVIEKAIAAGKVRKADAHENGNGSTVHQAQPQATSPAGQQAPDGSVPVANPGPYSPSAKQIAFFQKLADHPVFTAEERTRALDWLATKATRQTIKDQIDWLKRQTESRKGAGAGAHDEQPGIGAVATARDSDEPPLGEPPEGY